MFEEFGEFAEDEYGEVIATAGDDEWSEVGIVFCGDDLGAAHEVSLADGGNDCRFFKHVYEFVDEGGEDVADGLREDDVLHRL